jgi:uncharacterized protein YcbX
MVMNELYLSGIFIYPIKSLGGISLEEADIELKGLEYDRRWMLVDAEGTFVSQRRYHSLALLNVHLDNETVYITHRNDTSQTIDFTIGKQTGTPIDVTIWDDQSSAIEVDTKVSRWFSEFLGMEVRLVDMPQEINRYVDPRYAENQETVSFADGYPCLIIGQSSLDGLNDRLLAPVKMDRFRPNFVFTGGEPHLEDTFASFTIGSIPFTAVKPCARCVLVTIDQQTGSKSAEPLKTLAGYRTRNNKIMFGQNLLHSEMGTIRKGDRLQVITTKPAI